MQNTSFSSVFRKKNKSAIWIDVLILHQGDKNVSKSAVIHDSSHEQVCKIIWQPRDLDSENSVIRASGYQNLAPEHAAQGHQIDWLVF